MSRRTPLLALLLCAALAAPAQAATPFNAGTGHEPRIAVGADGTGHVVFGIEAASLSGPDSIGYCRVPKGGSACDQTLTLAFPDDGGDPARGTHAVVFAPAPGKVVVASSCYVCVDDAFDDVVLWTSTDNGATFGAAQVLGPLNPAADLAGVWLEDANRFVGISNDHLKAFQPDTATEVTHSTLGFNYGPEVARLAGTNMLVTASNDLENVQFSIYGGPSLSSADINAQANWSGPFALANPEGALNETGLISGPAGLYLHYRFFQANNTRVGLRRFDPIAKSFGAPVHLDADNPVDNNSLDYPDAYQDASGRIHAVWRTLYDGQRLRYTVSDTTGANFTAPGSLAGREEMIDLEVAAGPDGKGWAVWSAIGQATLIRVVALEPVPETGIAPEPQPVAFPTKKPTAKKKGKKVVVKAKGAIVPAAGAPCAGQVQIRVKRKKKTIGKGTVTVAADCTYARTLKIKRKKVKKAKRLKVILTFVPSDPTQVKPTKVSYLVRVR